MSKLDYTYTGKVYLCKASKSNFYTAGREYPLVKNSRGEHGFIANDGLFDAKNKVLSTLVELKEKDVNGGQPTYLLPVH